MHTTDYDSHENGRKFFFKNYFKRRKIQTHATAWMHLEDMVFSEIKQSQKLVAFSLFIRFAE